MLGLKSLMHQAKSKNSYENVLVKIYKLLMDEYGYIPYNDFIRTPLPITMWLVEQITDSKEKRKTTPRENRMLNKM